MTLGFKTGLKTFEDEGKRIVTELGAAMCEVRFETDRMDDFQHMLSWLHEHNVAVGLHHWGNIDGKYKTNLATHNDHIRMATIEQIRHAIDVGASMGCVYVNIHPGARHLEIVEHGRGGKTQRLADDAPTPPDVSRALFLDATKDLSDYAKEQGVLLTIETLTSREMTAASYDFSNRTNIYNPKSVDLPTMRQMAKSGVALANDIAHTAAQVAQHTDDPKTIWDGTYAFTRDMAPHTHVIHVNTVRPPFNGTDSHDGITDEDFTRGYFPDKQQWQDILALFKDRNDVFAVPEPQLNTGYDNFKALQKLADSL